MTESPFTVTAEEIHTILLRDGPPRTGLDGLGHCNGRSWSLVATRSLGHIERGMAAWESVPGVPTLRSVGHRRFGRAHAQDVSADAVYGAT